MRRPMRAWRCLITRGSKLLRRLPGAVLSRPRPLVLSGAVCVAALLFAGLARAEEAIPAGPPPTVGERWSFHGRWMGIPVGHGWIGVTERTQLDGRDVLHLEAHGETNDVLSKFYPIRDELHTYIDAVTFRPVRFIKHQREGHYRADEQVDFGDRTAHYTSLRNGSEKTVDLPEEFYDLLSAVFWIRRQPLAAGGRLRVNLYTDEKIYPTDILVGPRELLEVLKRGTFWTVPVEADKKAFKGVLVKRGRLWAYLTSDEHRLPLLLKATTPWGSMSAVLDQAAIPSGLGHDAADRQE